MDQQKHIPTEEEIARAEAEAVAAIQRGEKPTRPAWAAAPEAPAEAADTQDTAQDAAAKTPEAAPAAPDFVPYVDDVPEPEPAMDATTDDDDDDGEYIPGKWEQRINALAPEVWRKYQIIGGALLGLAAIAALFVFGGELNTYGLIVSVLLALVVPRYLQRIWRCDLTVAKKAMVIAMIIGLAVMFLIIGARNGFQLRRSDG